jgi:phage nucleotide-binding protein
MPLAIKSLAASIEESEPKICIYGFPGAGKTYAASTLPGKTLILSAEAGLLSLSGREFNADVAEVKSVDDLREAYRLLDGGSHDYQWVALDSFSEICEVLLSAEKAATKDTRQAYGRVIEVGMQMGRAFRDLKMGVYFACKAERQKDEATGRQSVALSMPGAKLAQGIPYLFDEVFHLFVDKDKETGETTRWLQCIGDARADCKDRSGRLDAYEPADLTHIVNKIKGEK